MATDEHGAANGSEDADDPMQGTPPKQRKKRRVALALAGHPAHSPDLPALQPTDEQG